MRSASSGTCQALHSALRAPFAQPHSATFRCCPQALKNPHTLSLLAQPERERAKTRLRTAAALTLWASAQTGALLNFQFRFGVAELALGVAYRLFGVGAVGMENAQSTQR